MAAVDADSGDDPKPELLTLNLSQIGVNDAAQLRAKGVQPWLVDQYAEDMKAGADFPPLDVFQDGQTFWLGSGFHRHAAARKCGRKTFQCRVRSGGLRAAILHACGANATHGFRRSWDDKRKAVDALLKDPEWSDWSDSKIARQCKVSASFVADRRKLLAPEPPPSSNPHLQTTKDEHIAGIGSMPGTTDSSSGASRKVKVQRGGIIYEQDITNIGRSRGQEAGRPQVPPPPRPVDSTPGLFDQKPADPAPPLQPPQHALPTNQEQWENSLLGFAQDTRRKISDWNAAYPGWQTFPKSQFAINNINDISAVWTELAKIIKEPVDG